MKNSAFPKLAGRSLVVGKDDEIKLLGISACACQQVIDKHLIIITDESDFKQASKELMLSNL